jgi:hypothetical protein
MSQQSLDRRFSEGLRWARWAVSRWSAFPVDRVPRPVVMAGQDVLVDSGFDSGEAKVAFLEGRIEWSVAVPDSVRSALPRTSPESDSRASPPLRIVGADRAQTHFMTDRGPTRLAAWRLRADGTPGPIWVLDPDIQPWRPPPGAGGAPPKLQAPPQDPGAQIEVEADDRSVTVRWLGSPPEYVTFPDAEAVESNQAVALVARGNDIGTTGYRPAVGYMHDVPARLREPLGARIFVDLRGRACQAIRSSTG